MLFFPRTYGIWVSWSCLLYLIRVRIFLNTSESIKGTDNVVLDFGTGLQNLRLLELATNSSLFVYLFESCFSPYSTLFVFIYLCLVNAISNTFLPRLWWSVLRGKGYGCGRGNDGIYNISDTWKANNLYRYALVPLYTVTVDKDKWSSASLCTRRWRILWGVRGQFVR